MAAGSSVSGLTALALRLAKPLATVARKSGGGNGNLVFSPLSIYSALGLVAAGARGAALHELLDLLAAASRDGLTERVRGFAERVLADTSASGGPRISYACGVWHDHTVALNPAFRAAAVGSHKAEVRAVDFRTKAEEARKEINSWVSEATKKLIADVLPPGDVHAETSLVLVNAIYFKGKWEEPFVERFTKVEEFYLLDGSSVETPLMSGRGSHLIAVHDGFKVLKLPYRAPRFDFRRGEDARGVAKYSLCVFLPDARDGLWSLVDELASSPAFLHDHLPEREVSVGKLRLPRFKMSFSCNLTDTLREMGLVTTLDPREAIADLSDMAEERSSGRTLTVDSLRHKAVIELNEKGTEAAAVTGVMMGKASWRSPPQEIVDFVADHPFAFFVMEEVSGAVVFAGCVLDPLQRE